jgi:hypothetical protein
LSRLVEVKTRFAATSTKLCENAIGFNTNPSANDIKP